MSAAAGRAAAARAEHGMPPPATQRPAASQAAPGGSSPPADVCQEGQALLEEPLHDLRHIQPQVHRLQPCPQQRFALENVCLRATRAQPNIHPSRGARPAARPRGCSERFCSEATGPGSTLGLKYMACCSETRTVLRGPGALIEGSGREERRVFRSLGARARLAGCPGVAAGDSGRNVKARC
jgi:hypothetical protein